ncbi:MAG: metal-dependent hydrolase [Pirellulaceae bacterium]|nr:metal-dependent hydrolase [Pirellulaceae bacterium]
MSSSESFTTDLTWYGHATWRLRVAGKSIWIDPFLNDNPSCPVGVADVEACHAVLLTHGHFDHVANAAELVNRFAATLVANYEIVQWFSTKYGVTNGIGMNVGGRTSVAGVSVKMVPAIHSSSLPDGSYGGIASGFLVETGPTNVYIAGDTCVFSDMSRVATRIDLAILPIGDLFTMGPGDSIEAIQLLKPTQVVPSHYNTWPPIAQDVQKWARDVKSQTNALPITPTIGSPFLI